MLFLRSLCYAALSTLAAAQLNLIYQFPPQPYVNIENVAIRSTNGQLLLNTVTGPTMYQLNPGSQPERIITLSGPGSLTGIAEVYKDVYVVAAGNFSFGPSVPGGVAGIAGTFSVWSIDLNGPQAVARQIVAIPEAGSLNGVTTIKGNKDTVLIADSALGAVWSVNVKSGQYKNVLSSPLFANSAAIQFGINGIHTVDCDLYWTNSAQATYGKVSINEEGYATSAVQVIANAPEGNFDDFALLKNGAAFIATQENAITYVDPSGQAAIIAGGGSDMTLVSPTSCVLSGSTLYIVTGGLGAPPPTGVSGQVFSLDVSSYLGGGKGHPKLAKKWIA